jgi:hypothetical protein
LVIELVPYYEEQLRQAEEIENFSKKAKRKTSNEKSLILMDFVVVFKKWVAMSIISVFIGKIGSKTPVSVLVIKWLNTSGYISESRLANSLGDKPGLGNP